MTPEQLRDELMHAYDCTTADDEAPNMEAHRPWVKVCAMVLSLLFWLAMIVGSLCIALGGGK